MTTEWWWLDRKDQFWNTNRYCDVYVTETQWRNMVWNIYIRVYLQFYANLKGCIVVITIKIVDKQPIQCAVGMMRATSYKFHSNIQTNINVG